MKPRGIRVAVLGAGGTIAPAIVRDLAASEEVGSMLLLDLDRDRAEAAAAEHGAGKAEAAGVDARAGLGGALGGVDVLVNSASYRINLDAMQACLEAGCHYLDLGGLYHVTAKQLELHGEFERAGLLAVLGIGSSPGKTNLMAALAVRELGAEVPPDSIEIVAAGRDLDPPGGLSFPYALQTLLDELTMAPVVLRAGDPIEVEPMSGGGTVDFGEPIGEAETIHTLHSELLTFGDSFGCGEATFRLSLEPGLLERLRGLAGADPRRVAEAAAAAEAPSGGTVAVHLVIAKSGGLESRVRSITRPHRQWGLGGGIVSTASPAAAAVRLLARGEVTARGALPPERCLQPETVFAELRNRGVEITSELRGRTETQRREGAVRS